MNKRFAIGLVGGLGIGLICGALIAKSKNREPDRPTVVEPAPPPPVPPPPPPKEIPQDAEVATLKARVVELEEKLAARIQTETAPAPEVEAPAPAEWTERFKTLAKKGLEAFGDPDFGKLAADLKKQGARGIESLASLLLNSESAQDRFMAAALLEGMGDPAAIPALAKALQQDDDELVRRMSSHAIAMIKNEAGLPALRAAMGADSDWGVRVNSAYGVAKLGHADGVRALEDAYRSPTTPADYRIPVLGGLADVASPTSAPIFRKILAESTDISYLYIVIGAVQKMKDASFIPDLNKIVGDAKYSANVREMAKKAADGLAK